jgi:hypothetical protein
MLYTGRKQDSSMARADAKRTRSVYREHILSVGNTVYRDGQQGSGMARVLYK